MPDLTYRQQKIQEKRKQTSFRDFVREICSWQSFTLKKRDALVTKYGIDERSWNLVSISTFWENRDTMVNYGKDVDGGRSFFSQFQQLFLDVPKSVLMHYITNDNAEYSDTSLSSKNVYLSFHSTLNVENILYSVSVKHGSSNVLNCFSVTNSENIFYSRGIVKSFNIFYSNLLLDCADMWFCNSCIGCQNCISCDNLINKSYCIENIAYSREEFQAKKQEILGQKRRFQSNSMGLKNIQSESSQGVGLVNCNGLTNAFFTNNISSGNNVILGGSKEMNYNAYDMILWGGVPWSWWYYACVSVGGSEQMYCCIGITYCNTCFYCYHMENCSFCLWCVGLQNKSYCIFNKEYSKEERHTKVDEIFTQMEKDWTLGQFFPAMMNPFYFNDTAAYLIDPSFTKEEVEKAGYLRRDEPIKVDIPADLEQVKVSKLDQYEGYDENGKWQINEEILKKVIIDEEGNVRRIVNMEYVFLMKYGLPLPRKHRLERMKENFRIG